MIEREIFWMMKYLRRSLRKWFSSFRGNLADWGRFWNSYHDYKKAAPPDRHPLLKHFEPCLGDDTGKTIIEPIYFYQDAWAFEKIVKKQPVFHIDVGSHHKFVALLSKVVPVTMVDIRPLSLPLDTLTFRKGSVLNLPFEDGTVPSVSSLCVVEHIGLGRYGDTLDPYGTEKAIHELKRIVQHGGDLYLSLPIHDENRIYFNAHRAFEERYLFGLFEPFQIINRGYIYGQTFGNQRKSGFGTGCYHLRRV